MHPVEARAWITGASIRSVEASTPRDFWKAWSRFYIEEVPPPVREQLMEQLKGWREVKEDEPRVLEMPAPFMAALLLEDLEKEEEEK
jgi:hypothetical protein